MPDMNSSDGMDHSTLKRSLSWSILGFKIALSQQILVQIYMFSIYNIKTARAKNTIGY